MSVANGFYKFNEWIDLPYNEQPWLIKPLIPAGGWVNLYGQPKKARKSYLATGMSWAVSSGQDQWLGFDVPTSGPVAYFQVDTPHTIWRQRNLDISKGGYDLSNIWFASMSTIPYPFNITEHADTLNEMINDIPEKPVMIIYDTGRKMHQLDENSSQDMTMVMGLLEEVAGIGMAKVLVTHSKKGGGEGDQDAPDETDGGDLMKNNRGSSAVAGAVDTVIEMTPKGYMKYQGRAVGEGHKKLKFTHVFGEMGFMWEEDVSPETAEARKLLTLYKLGSERSLARILAKRFDMDEEKARAIIRKQKEHK